jgi:hypothetical protein
VAIDGAAEEGPLLPPPLVAAGLGPPQLRPQRQQHGLELALPAARPAAPRARARARFLCAAAPAPLSASASASLSRLSPTMSKEGTLPRYWPDIAFTLVTLVDRHVAGGATRLGRLGRRPVLWARRRRQQDTWPAPARARRRRSRHVASDGCSGSGGHCSRPAEPAPSSATARRRRREPTRMPLRHSTASHAPAAVL